MSRPIVVTACMPASSDPWPPHRRPPPWHLRAGGGAVHSIKSGRADAGSYVSLIALFRQTFGQSYQLGVAGGSRDQAAWARVVKGRCPPSVAPKAGTETLDAISQALAYRDGLLLAFQAMMSLRLGEFTLRKLPLDGLARW